VKWECEFGGSEAHYLSFGVSDHSLMSIKVVRMPKRKVPFKKKFIFELTILGFLRQWQQLGRLKSRALRCLF